MKNLQKNSRLRIFEVLETIASKDLQINYKAAVPFVHIPYELICQWDDAFMKQQKWFRDCWSTREWQFIILFGKKYESLLEGIPNEDYPDVPEVFDDKIWIEMMRSAQETLVKLQSE